MLNLIRSINYEYNIANINNGARAVYLEINYRCINNVNHSKYTFLCNILL